MKNRNRWPDENVSRYQVRDLLFSLIFWW